MTADRKGRKQKEKPTLFQLWESAVAAETQRFKMADLTRNERVAKSATRELEYLYAHEPIKTLADIERARKAER